ncbi:MAG: glutamate racemase [Candidatus Sumerlaeia bacterium]
MTQSFAQNPASHSIGIFDSGLGGLTVAREIRRAFPRESICYLGDTARVPYGTKSPATVKQYAREIITFLIDKGVKVVIAACNTVSAAALPSIQDEFPVKVMGVVEMGARVALENAPGHVGVIGTETTIGSEAYVRAIHAIQPDAKVIQKACPLFVPLIEEGWLDHDVSRQVIAEYLGPMRETGIDSLILGCTHYPLLKPLLAEFFGPEVRVVDSAEAMVVAMQKAIETGQVPAAPQDHQATCTYYATDRCNRFRELVGAFMGEEVNVEPLALDEISA